MRSIWINRLITSGVWLAAAASIVFWALKFSSGPVAPAMASVADASAQAQSSDSRALAQGLGAIRAAEGNENTPNLGAAPEVSTGVSTLNATRFVLSGVIFGRTQAALIAVDGKPVRTYRVGATLAEGVVLKSVSPGKAMLATSSQATASLTLELPKQTSAMVGNAVKPVVAAPVVPTPSPQVAALANVQAIAQNSAQGAAEMGKNLANRLRERAPGEAPNQ